MITANTIGLIAQEHHFIGSNKWYYLIFELNKIAVSETWKINIKNWEILKFKPIEKPKYIEILKAFNITVSEHLLTQRERPTQNLWNAIETVNPE